jgi:hypothetical protein
MEAYNTHVHHCNIRAKQLQHTYGTTETLKIYAFNAKSSYCLGEWRLVGVWSSSEAVDA